MEGGTFLELQTITIPAPRTAQRVRSFNPPAISSLDHNVSQSVTREDEQLVSVGSHWPLTGPLPSETCEKVERMGFAWAATRK